MKETRVNFSKFENDKQIAYGEVYVPFVPDSQGDYMSPGEIERIAHNFLRRGKVSAIDTEHNLMKNGSVVVESFIAREGDPNFLPGSWVLGIHIPDRRIWDMAKSGELGGFSMYGSGRREQRVVEIEIPDNGTVFGKTAGSAAPSEHRHVFALDFDQSGNFLGGETSDADGHSHKILKGTVTEPGGVDGHRHRYTLVDALLQKTDDLTDEEKAWRQAKIEKAEGRGNPWKNAKGKFSSEDEDEDGQAHHYTGSDGKGYASNIKYDISDKEERQMLKDLKAARKRGGLSSSQKSKVDQLIEDVGYWDTSDMRAIFKILSGGKAKPAIRDRAAERRREKEMDDLLDRAWESETPASRKKLLEKEDMSQADLDVAGKASPEQGFEHCEDCTTPKKCKRLGCQAEAQAKQS